MHLTSDAQPAEYGCIRFRHIAPLGPAAVDALLSDLVAHLPIAPDYVRVSPTGDGSVGYGDDWSLTADEMAGLVAWLHDHPRLRDVRWEPSMQPSQVLTAGAEILAPALEPSGFQFRVRGADQGSGGHFAWGEFVRGERRLELHFRWSLGLVTYHLGEVAVAHEPLMRATLGSAGGNEYPGFSDDPLDGFRHLRHDLECYGGIFLRGTDEAFAELALKALAIAPVSGFKALSQLRDSGDFAR